MKAASRHAFQMLTKRADRMRAFVTRWTGATLPLPNVWLGVSVEDQRAADERIPELLATPAAVRFLSCEPLLGPVDLTPYFFKLATSGPGWKLTSGLALEIANRVPDRVIVGGESGPGARPCDVAWVRSLVEQCRAAQVPAFVKQLGANVEDRNDAGFMGEDPTSWPIHIFEDDRTEEHPSDTGYQGAPVRVHLRDRKGGDPAEWPEDLRVRQMPEVDRA
jgi:protein gp37